MLRVLFLCTGNSCRSQMAEGWTHHLKAGLIKAYSAGIVPHGLHPDAVRVMAEAGVDISGQWSKQAGGLRGIPFDFVVTLSERARKACPAFLGTSTIRHVGCDSPPRRAANAQTEEERLMPYRQVRDEIRRLVEALPELLYQRAEASMFCSDRG